MENGSCLISDETENVDIDIFIMFLHVIHIYSFFVCAQQMYNICLEQMYPICV